MRAVVSLEHYARDRRRGAIIAMNDARHRMHELAMLLRQSRRYRLAVERQRRRQAFGMAGR